MPRRKTIRKRLTQSPGHIVPTNEDYERAGITPVPIGPGDADLSRIIVYASAADVPAKHRYTAGRTVTSTSREWFVYDRWGQEPDRPCAGEDACHALKRALNAAPDEDCGERERLPEREPACEAVEVGA